MIRIFIQYCFGYCLIWLPTRVETRDQHGGLNNTKHNDSHASAIIQTRQFDMTHALV